MRPFFYYYGGKYRHGGKYPLPRYELIIEPFAGSAGYTLRNYVGHKVWLNDLDPVVFGVWKYLTQVSPTEIRKLPILREGDHIDDFKLIQEAKDFIGFNLQTGRPQPNKRLSSPGKKKRAVWSEALRERE